ncbi:hypothetical protein CsSME_00027262 [Camellia sinensis var. sinensis]
MWAFCMKPPNEGVLNVSFRRERFVIRLVTKPRTSAWTLSYQPTYVSSVEVLDMSNGQSHRPSVIPRLLTGYAAKPIEAGLSIDPRSSWFRRLWVFRVFLFTT